MRYFYALICPPLAFLSCGSWGRAALAMALFAAALATAHLGVGVAIEFLLILWAVGAVGDEAARVESDGFVAEVTGSRARRDR